jgi:hypothetical protein
MEKQNRVVAQKETVTNDSSSNSLHRLRKRWDKAEAETVDEPDPADYLKIDLKGFKDPVSLSPRWSMFFYWAKFCRETVARVHKRPKWFYIMVRRLAQGVLRL